MPQKNKTNNIFKIISLVSSYLLVIIATTVMIAWFIKNQTITQINTIYAPTHFNAALSIFLMGLSIIFIVYKKPKLSIIPLLFVFVIATLTIIEYLFNLKFGIDELFIKDYILIKTSSPGRMGINTAISLILGSFGLLAISLKLFKKYFNYVLFPISIVIGFIAIISLVGYVIGLESAYGWGNWTRMSIITSISFFIMSIGLFSWFWHNFEKKSILNSTIQWRLIIRIIIPVILIYIMDSIADISHLKKITEQKTDAELTALSYQFAEKIENKLFNATEILKEARREILLRDSINEEQIYKLLEGVVDSDSLIYGSALLFNEYAYNKKKRLFGPYAYKPDSTLLRLDLADEIDYMRTDVEWFNKARDAGKSVWTEPYFDEGITNLILCTYSVPIYHKKDLWAVITLDLSLEELPGLMKINTSDELQYYIVSTEGTFLYNSTRPNLVGKNHFENSIQYKYNIADSLPKLFSTDVSGKFEYIGNQTKNENWLYYIPINSAPWKVYLGISEYNAIEEVRTEILNQLLVMLFIISLLTIIIILISKSIAKPIKLLNTAVKHVAEGDYHTIIKTKSKNELGQLAKSFNLMNTKLVSREKELIEKEQRYRALIESSNTGAWEFNSETNFLWCSKEYFTMLGRDEADYDLSGNDNLKKVWIDLLHPEDREKAANQFSNYLEGGSVGMYESIFRMKHKDGYWVWVWSRARTLRSEDNSIKSKTIGTHIDISKQKETDEAQKRLIHEVGERMKELNCLYEVYKILDNKGNTITDILNKIVKIIPPSWQYPDITCAKINFLNQEYITDNFVSSEWSQKEDILINNEKLGSIEVYYTEERPASDIGPFMKEEQHLIEAIAIQIANFYIKKIAEDELLKSKELLEEKVEERTAELKESQSQFSSMVSNVPGVIYRCLLDEAWTMLFISDEIQTLSGYPASDFLNNSKRTFADIIHEDDISRTAAYINETLNKNETFRVEYRIRTAKGDIKWVRGQGQAISDESNEILYLDGVVFDITEQKMAEIELAKAVEKVNLILESAGEGVIGVDLHGKTSFINTSATKMLGYSQDEIIGKGIHGLIHSKLHDGSNYPVEDCPMYETYTNNLTNHVDTEVLWRKDGSSFPVDYISKPIIKDGNCVGAVITFSDITERKEAEEELLLSRYALDHAGDSILWIDVNTGKLKYVNEKSRNTLEYSQEELLELHVFDIDPNVTKESWKQLSGKIKKERILNFESTNKRKGGELFPIEITATYIKFGELEHIIAFTRDISERKKNEEETHKLLTAVEKSPVMVSIATPKGIVDYVNPEYSQVTGFSSKEVIGKSHSLLNTGVLSRTEYDEIFKHLQSQKHWSGELESKKKDGSAFWSSLSLAGVHDKAGDLTHIVIIEEDITDRKKSEQKLLIAKETSERIIDESPIPMLITSKKGVILKANNSFLKLVNLSSFKQLSKYNIVEMYVDGENRTKIVSKIKTEGIIKDQALDIKLFGTGEKRTVLFSMILIDYSGKEEMLTTFIDVTDTIRHRKELEKAKELAENATKTKSDFLAKMSHEIRTPMNAIIGLSQLAMATELNSKQYDYIKKVNSSGYALLGIINDILDFSKIEAGKLTFEKIDFDLEQVFQEHADVVTYKAHEKNLEFILGMGKDVPFSLIGDPLRLRQVLVNLVNNAIKFTSKGEITVKVDLANESKDDVKLRFSVKDSGIGIEQKKMDRLFESFTQADNSTTRKYGGSGLGLAISKGIVEALGGKIWAKSEVGKGSTFYFEMIFRKQAKQKKQELKPIPDIRGLSILLCDDNPTAREVLKATLEDLTFKVKAVSSGKEAIREIEQSKENAFDLVLMDWKMPEMDGVETIKKIESDFGKSKIPAIIMVTAYNREDIYQEINQLDVSGLLIKPVSHSNLLNSVMDAFGNDEGKRQYKKKDIYSKSDLLSGIKGSSILLVEDHEINQQVARELIEAAGCNVTIAQNGQVAVNTLKDNPEKFQLVFMDIQMPVMDGFTATQHIRQKLNLKKIPIIAMTADAITGVKDKCLNVGMNEFITKPIDTNKLLDTLLKFIKPGTFEAVEVIKSAKSSVVLNIPDFKHINKKEGLIRVNHNDKLYAELLGKFYKTYYTFDDDVKKLMKKDASELKRYIHTLKGTAGNIGANDLHKDTVELESKYATTDFSQHLPAYTQKLNFVLDELGLFVKQQDALKANAQSQSGSSVKILADISDVLKDLSKLIEDNDIEATDSLKTILLENIEPELKTRLTQVLDALDDFDFDKANELLNQIN